MVIGAAGCFLADVVFYSEYRYKTAAKFSADTQNAAPTPPLASFDCLLDDNPQNAQLIYMGLAEGATSLPEFQHPQKVLYIFTLDDGSI